MTYPAEGTAYWAPGPVHRSSLGRSCRGESRRLPWPQLSGIRPECKVLLGERGGRRDACSQTCTRNSLTTPFGR